MCSLRSRGTYHFLTYGSLKHNILNSTVVSGGSTLYHINVDKLLSPAPYVPYLTMPCSSMYHHYTHPYGYSHRLLEYQRNLIVRTSCQLSQAVRVL